MNPELINRLMANMDEEEVREALSQVDFEMVFREMAPYLERAIEPHLVDIRERAQYEDDPQEVREHYASLSEEEQQAAFEETVADLVAVLRDCREQPDVGFGRLKTRIRDPDVLEPLLLLFDPPPGVEHEEEYVRDTKDFAALMVRWAAAQVIPEIYTQAETGELQSRLSGN